MDKFKILKLAKKFKESDLKKDNSKNDKYHIKDNYTPNRVPLNKTRTHIKIKSRDIKNLNIFTDDESNSKINTTTFKNENRYTNINLPKSKLKPNKTLNNILTLKLHKKEKIKNNNNNSNSNNSENYKKVLYLWEELGVNYVYQSIFNKISNSLNKEKRENYYIYEINKLNNIYKIINLIFNDINNRDQIIFELQNNYYKSNESETHGESDNNNFDEEIIKQIVSVLLDLRKYSIDIVNNLNLLRKEISFDIIMNKYDINKILIFPNDYLIKMNNDLDFLINSSLNKYFKFSKSDPFLTKLNNNININNNNYQLPEIKEENEIFLINNYDYFVFDELVNQEVNLMTINSKNSFDSIFNFAPKYKMIKKNNSKLTFNNNNNNNIIKKKKPVLNKIIKANRGLSRQKLRPKLNNKMAIDAEISNISNKIKSKINHTINNNIHKYSNTNINQYEKKTIINENNHKDHINLDDEKNVDIFNYKYSNIKMNEVNDDDMKIFEKIIEQSIMEKNNIDKEILSYNDKNKLKSKSNKKNKKIEKIEDINSNTSISYKIKEKEIKKEKEIEKDKEEEFENSINKKEISNFINKIIEESEIENSQKISVSKSKNFNNNNKNENDYNMDNIEIDVDPIKKEYSNFIIELYKDKLSELKNIYRNYFRNIPEKIKIGFNIQSNITKYIEGIYPKILVIKKKDYSSNIIGIVTLNYIANNSNIIVVGKTKSSNYNKILNISSISCLNESQFEDILINTIDFCKEFLYFESIILQLFYQNKNGQFVLYTELEKIIKNKAKFKWVNMENDGINRKIKYKYSNNSYNMNMNDEDYKNNIINLKSVNTIGYIEEKDYNNMDIRQLSFINDFSINYLLLEMIGQKSYKIIDKKNEGNNYINMLINKVTFKKINHLCSDFLISQIGNSDEIKNFVKENENVFNNSEVIKKIDQRIYHELYFSIAILNINNTFKNIIKRKYNGYIYNILFNDQINEFSIKDKNNKDMQFYLIKTGEQNSSIIIYEFKRNETLEDILKIIFNKNGNENSEKNISEVFKDLFAKVTKRPTKINKNIYIPSFKMLINQLAFRPSIYSDIVLENDKKYKINCLNFIEELTFGIDEPFIVQQNVMDLDLEDFGMENDNGNRFGGDIIIDNDFIISVVDNDLIFELQIPTVSTFLVKKNYWIKSS